jgi:hypothetical protein
LACHARAQISSSFNLDDAVRSYFSQLFPLNAGGIIPSGPTLSDLQLLDLSRPSEELADVFYLRPVLASQKV